MMSSYRTGSSSNPAIDVCRTRNQWQADNCKEITTIIGNNFIINILFPINLIYTFDMCKHC